MPGRNSKSRDVIWVRGMRLGGGGRHDPEVQGRIKRSKRTRGSGTVKDPKVIWLYFNRERSEAYFRAVEALVKKLTTECGLSHAWIMSRVHSFSTIGRTNDARIMCHDDFHITIRMGSSQDICNLQGHLYLICEDNDVDGKPVRLMNDDERGIIGGKNPHLWIWGQYPAESRDWPRAGVRYPKAPYEIIGGSILDAHSDFMPSGISHPVQIIKF
ncbi:hypothetical protein GGS23DRAFT_594850 [Durotheca rogersii]|uniref:uncharacterized protein n=1 Tax=Durotheca rogersii TaxID=419775 RepID=UPI00221E9630|nr:uncharacterized protein GGS23DRAFT_594850 [Durotheca rogersii]KAI5865310.1 hypothetical protein GGS23DRAFT_594850 [Durotheca rogersii]